MANLTADEQRISFSFSFSDFPEDVQFSVLSFLAPSELATFACTSKRFLSLCRSDGKLWFALCHRRWGSRTQIAKWGQGNVNYRRLYRTLNEYENLIGFWRRSGQGKNAAGAASPTLVFFEWGPSFVVGSRVFPSKTRTYQVVKTPFLWLSVMPDGSPVSFLDPDCRSESAVDVVQSSEFSFRENELLAVNVYFMGKCHLVVEENINFAYSNSMEEKKFSFVEESGSPVRLPDPLMSEIYQYFANRTSPGGDRVARRQRRREKEKQGRRKWDPEHFVKVINWSPTPSKPLQGLWKGISDDMTLDFYLVAYDDIGGITCRRVGDSFSIYSPVFWTSNTTFIEAPFSPEEEYLYENHIHLQQVAIADTILGRPPCMDSQVVSHILYINSSYDLVIPDLVGATMNPRHVEGRIWRYRDGTFGFGFLRNNHITDLKPIAQDGCILDTIDICSG
ncbi:F-box protein At3g12350-like [Diospyros lotus]|uniref:F-box protein At3g12350-like n=1 Tax=Diospyros lotus TaxID=55363 RepID=UPI002258C11E|nr:F-box protein At3g12350-like [Diospyros lotus]